MLIFEKMIHKNSDFPLVKNQQQIKALAEGYSVFKNTIFNFLKNNHIRIMRSLAGHIKMPISSVKDLDNLLLKNVN